MNERSSTVLGWILFIAAVFFLSAIILLARKFKRTVRTFHKASQQEAGNYMRRSMSDTRRK